MTHRSTGIGALLAAAILTAGITSPPAHAHDSRTISSVERAAMAQLAYRTPAGGPAQVDPRQAFLPDPSAVDLAQVARLRTARTAARVRPIDRRLAPPATYAEREPTATQGRNDVQAAAERIAGFGTRAGKNPRVSVKGTLAEHPGAPTQPPAAEDNGSIPLAIDTGLGAKFEMVRTSGVIGDGPHGSSGDAHGDFDFYKISGLAPGARVTVSVRPSGGLYPILALYSADGEMLIFVAGGQLNFPAGTADQYLMIAGMGPLPSNPKDSGSGGGTGFEGLYSLSLYTNDLSDRDFYTVDLRAGDVLGASVKGAAGHLAVFEPSGREAIGSAGDASGAYAPQSPLPGGGNAVLDFVAPADGRYALEVTGGAGAYDTIVEAYRPGTETTARNTVQTIFLDFDGARVNTAIFGGPGVRELSPLSAFLTRWGLAAKDEKKLVNAVVAAVKENVAKDLAANGTNPGFAVRILNSREHADPFGQPNVTRLIVGGTIEESGIGTIGIAQSIDPGNFGREETALILLDMISSQDGDEWSLNSYLTPASDRIAFVGRALGNIAVHELGHVSGNWHVDQFNDTPDLMDQGGNFPVMVGIGADGIGGTADDTDVDFGADQLNAREGFTGTENTRDRMAWAYSRGKA